MSESTYLGFAIGEIIQWRKDVADRRELSFRRRWQNPRHIPALTSLADERGFEFVLDWYKEAAELADRQRNNRYYQRLLDQGINVRVPVELLPAK